MKMEWLDQQTSDLSLESLTNMLLGSFTDHHVDILSINIERWMKDWVPIEKYIRVTGPINSSATSEERTKHFISLLLCFAIDLNASIEDTRNAFSDGEDDSLLLLFIMYVELSVAHVRGPAHFAVKHACIIEESLPEFYNAARALLTESGPVVLSPESGYQSQNMQTRDAPISIVLICRLLHFLLPQTKTDRFKLYHAKLQHIPYLLIADTTLNLEWRCLMVNYIVENKLVWEKDVDSDVFLISVFKPCLDGMNSLVLHLDLHTDIGIMQLLRSMLLIYLLIETYDIDRLFKILTPRSKLFDEDCNGGSSYFGFLDTISVKPVCITEPGVRKTLVRTRSVSNLQTHSLNMPSSSQTNTVTSFTCFINFLTTCAKLIYTQRSNFMTNPCAFQEICRILFCSISVLLFSLLTCLGNLSSSAFPLSLTNFKYILRCGLLFAGANSLGEANELEYQAACLFYHLDKIVQCHIDAIVHQKLDLPGFTGDDKLRNTREFLFKPPAAKNSYEYNTSVCFYFGLSPEEIGPVGIIPLSVSYTKSGSLYLLASTSSTLLDSELSCQPLPVAGPHLHTLSSLHTQVIDAVQFIIFHVFQYESAITSGLFYAETISIKILDPQFSTIVEVIAEYLSHKELSISKNLIELFSIKFIQALVLLLYAYSTCYSKHFLDKSNILYNRRYHLISTIVQLILDLLFVLPHEHILSALLYRPELCLLPSALISTYQSLSCPKQIHLHMPLLLLVVDLLNDFIYRLTKYTSNCAIPSFPYENDISKAVKTLVSSIDFAQSAVSLIERLITCEWANVGRNCSIIVELLLLGLIEYFHLSPEGTKLLRKRHNIPNHVIKVFNSVTLHMKNKQPVLSPNSGSKEVVLLSSMGDVSFLMSSRTIEIVMSILTFYKSELINFITEACNADTLKSITDIFLSSIPRYPYSRGRHLPFFAYVFIYGYSNKALAHMAGSIIWTSANYLLWPSTFLYGFLEAMAILRTFRHSFGFYNLLVHQFFTGTLGRGPLDRLYSFPSVLQLKMTLEPRAQFDNILELECCAPYAKQQEVEPLLCCISVVEHIFLSYRAQKPLSTWQSVQALAIPSLSVKDVLSVNLSDALFNIRENEVQTKRGPYMHRFKQILTRVLCLKSPYNVKQIQSFASVCSLRGHIMYTLNRSQSDPLLPLTLLFILLHTTCNLKNWIYEVAGWATAYECIPIFTNALQSQNIPIMIQNANCIDFHHKYLHLLVDLLEELILNGFHSPTRLGTTSGMLRSVHDNIKTIRKRGSPIDLKLSSTLSSSAMYHANNHLAFNTAAVFAIWTGYLHLLLSFLTAEHAMETIKSANINPLKLVFVLTALLENYWVVRNVYSLHSFTQSSSSSILEIQAKALPLMVQILAEICSLPNECEYINFILTCERSDVPNFTILKSLTKKSGISIYHHHRVKNKHRAISTPTPLSVNSLEVENSHIFICQHLKKYFKDEDILRWLFKSKWSLYHVARSSNIALCAKLGFEFYCAHLNGHGFGDFLYNLLHYFRYLYNPITMQWIVFNEKIINHNEIFSQIEVDCPEALELSNCSLIDIIVHTLKLSLSTPSLMDNSIPLLEILSHISPLSNLICQPTGTLTYENMQIMGTVLQLALQSHNLHEFEKGVIATYTLTANLFTAEEISYMTPSCIMINKSDLFTQHDSIFQEDVGLKLLFQNDSIKLPLCPSLLPIAAFRFILDNENWDSHGAIILVIALIKFIFSQEQRFSIFLLSQVCYHLFNNLIATSSTASYCNRIKIIQAIVEGAEALTISTLCISDLDFSKRYHAFVLCLHAITHKFQQDMQKYAPSSMDMRVLLNAVQRGERCNQIISAYSSLEEVLGIEDKEIYGGLLQVLAEYCAEHSFPRSSLSLNSHETVPIPSQKPHPNQCTFEDPEGESLALSP